VKLAESRIVLMKIDSRVDDVVSYQMLIALDKRAAECREAFGRFGSRNRVGFPKGEHLHKSGIFRPADPRRELLQWVCCWVAHRPPPCFDLRYKIIDIS
jgi:hypothetical protein